MAVPEKSDGGVISLANLPATSRQRQFVLVVAVLMIVAFSVLLPFEYMQLAELNAVVPVASAVMSMNDLITSFLLYAQCWTVPSRSFLVLAGSYLFTALIIIPHALTFPGAFTATDLLGAGPQTSPWLYFSAHLVFPAALVGYARLKDVDDTSPLRRSSARSTITASVAVAVSLASGLTLLATLGNQYLPALLIDRTHAIRLHLLMINGAIIVLTAIALVSLWVRRRTVLDYWLMLVCVALILEEACFSLSGVRFSLGFYTGRVLWLITSMIVLVLLVVETTRLYARLAHSYALLERERNNKLLNARAITASVAHEVRQPLTAIVASGGAALQYLARVPPDHEKIRQSLNRVISESHRTSRVFDSIRALFEKTNHEPEAVDVNEMVREVLRLLDTELKDNGIITLLEVAELPRIGGYRNQLQQVVFNIAHNAIEAMQNLGDRKRLLRIRTECRGGDAVAIAVEDSGPGIDPARRDSIFSAFVTTKPHGMGLGLAICRQIVEQHGGRLVVSSDGSSGAQFQVVLPLGTAKQARDA